MAHLLDWITPAPLWPSVRDQGSGLAGAIAQPALLRFASDQFMEELFAVLARDPAQVGQYRARHETWRGEPQQAGREQLLAAPRPLAQRARTLKTRALARLGIGGSLLAQTPPATLPAPLATPPLKLYQPAHQRYYLVTASLVCQRPGFPDHLPDNAKAEQTGFVLRRLMPATPLTASDALPALDLDSWEEYAWVSTPQGPGWQKLGRHRQDSGVLTQAAGEELLPLFPLNFAEPNGHRRTMLAGLVPVGRREQYLGGRKLDVGGNGVAQSTGASPRTARMAALRMQVTEPWKRLVESAYKTRRLRDDPQNAKADDQDPAVLKLNIVNEARDQLQHGSWLTLLALADFLKLYLPADWALIAGSTALDPADPLYAVLENTVFSDADAAQLATPAYPASAVKRTLRQALQAITAGEPVSGEPDPAADTPRNRLDKATTSFRRSASSAGWPGFLFPLADPMLPWQPVSSNVPPLGPGDQADVQQGGAVQEGTGGESAIRDRVESIDKLLALIVRRLPLASAPAAPAVPAAAERRLDFRDGWFVIRCVLSRPHCAPIHPHIVSAPTEPFKLASFYDPDAPARPIRIALPFDTTPAGFSKFHKNTAFEISNVLCGQVQRAKGLSFGDLVMSVLPWPFHKDLGGADGGPCTGKDPQLALGMICSLSIPIITICAFILLIIMVSLLDLIFRWLPWFITCFPVPGLKAKR
ncbi:hypothetical protein ABWL39_08780 [Chitinivorax sp. PXF-14]|uniref:hypothetical protein n=1 Tax=Chitinivorax sp. PXF-14 TaxID=3230488 RepID=UPI0034674CAB